MPKGTWDPQCRSCPNVGGGDVAVTGRRKREDSSDKIICSW